MKMYCKLLKIKPRDHINYKVWFDLAWFPLSLQEQMYLENANLDLIHKNNGAGL